MFILLLFFYIGVILKNIDVSFLFFYGGLFLFIVIYFLVYKFLEKGSFFKFMLDGFKSVGLVILVLMFVWVIGFVIRDDV